MRTIRNFVDGKFVDGDTEAGRFADLNPVDGSVVATVIEADRNTVNLAVRAARAALDGPWGRFGVPERARLLRRIADEIEARFEEFVTAEVADTGRLVRQARELDVARAPA